MRKMIVLAFACVLLFSSSMGGFLIGYKIAENKSIYNTPQNFSEVKSSKFAVNPVGSNMIANVAQSVMPWVVNIQMEYGKGIHQGQQEGAYPFMPFFDFDNPSNKMKLRVIGGSGVIIRKGGYILTNDHVIKNADNIVVTLNSGKTYKAKIVGVDDITDIAVLKINPESSLPVAKIGDSSKLRIGDWIIAVGSPLGYSQSVTQGIISAINRRVKDIPTSVDFIQTDAAINPGNSGGPLVDMSGEVIGINTAIRADAQNIGFAIPSNTVRNIVDQLIKTGEVIRPWVGIEIKDIEATLPEGILIPDNSNGVIIRRIIPGSPAAKAKLLKNDIIMKVDGSRVKDVRELQAKIRNHKIGEKVKLDVLRGNKTLNLFITTEKLPDFKN